MIVSECFCLIKFVLNVMITNVFVILLIIYRQFSISFSRSSLPSSSFSKDHSCNGISLCAHKRKPSWSCLSGGSSCGTYSSRSASYQCGGILLSTSLAFALS